MLADFFVLNKLATVGSGQAFFDLTDKPLVIADQPLNRLSYQGLTVAALLRSLAVKFGFKIWREIYFHAVSVETPAGGVKTIEETVKVGSTSVRRKG
jgi:hypothetical protein